jgi:tellurite resistance protein TerC
MLVTLDWLHEHWLQKPLWVWLAFFVIIVCLLAFDLGVLHKKQREIEIKESLWLTLFYIVISFLYGLWIWQYLGSQSAQEYFTGYLVEKSLSLDNVFVISLIFSYFHIPRRYQHRVLFWGILGVIILRAIMIGLGAALISRFEWMTYLFALFLIITGIKMFFIADHDPDMSTNPILRFLQNHLRVTKELHGQKFSVLLPHEHHPHKKQMWVTPLLLALVLIEIADVIFAVDSVPAIFSITRDPFIVYTSNIFAILGLRALYFALAAIIHRFTYLKYALALILIFIGGKVYIAWILGIEKVPAGFSLGVTIAILASGMIFSLYKTREQER